ncbi:hypothetical protein RsS62_50420 [Rhizobium dioscoreae]|nr:hypothetical protein RsS62_50420 [Rhizobium dioscoreae]
MFAAARSWAADKQNGRTRRPFSLSNLFAFLAGAAEPPFARSDRI